MEIGKKTGATLIAPYGLQFAMKQQLGYPEKQATLATGGNVGGTLPPMVEKSVAAGNPVGYVIAIDKGPTIYHTGDTDLFGDMRLIADFHKVDLMLCVIGGHFTMDPERAAQAVQWVNPKQVVPMHFGTYPILAGTPARFKAALDKKSLGDRMVEMKPGETKSF